MDNFTRGLLIFSYQPQNGLFQFNLFLGYGDSIKEMLGAFFAAFFA